MAFSEDFEADLKDPILLRDIELTKEKIDYLEANKEKCFLCAWILEDYKANKTLTGVKRDGGFGKYEIFPLRGEINHLWLEIHGKPYPFKKKVSECEAKPTVLGGGSVPVPPGPPLPISKPVASFPPAPPSPVAHPPEITKNIDALPVAKPKR
jgi:hypothetical protein